MEYFFWVMFFWLGAALGSFVNMLVYRVARKYKLEKRRNKRANTGIRPYNDKRSFCDFCGRQLRWWENVPIFSWLFLRGRSSCCANPLPWQYPVVELVMGVMFVFGWGEYGDSPVQIVARLGIITLLVFLVVFDLKYMILPDFGVFILIGLALVGVVFDEPNIIPYLLSSAGGFLFLGGLHWLTKGKGMGFGDAKLAIFMGLFLGWPKILVAFYAAFILGAVVGLGLVVLGRVGRKSQIAFGPFLILGTVIAWIWGNEIIKIIII